MKKTLLTAICMSAALALAGCATASSGKRTALMKPEAANSQLQRHDYMVGRWLFESLDTDGLLVRELDETTGDGKYKMTFRKYNPDGSYTDDVEVGEWGISGNVYFTITKGWLMDGRFQPTDPTDPTFYDAYIISELSAELIKYKHVEIGSEFTGHKVASTYVLPLKP